MYRRFARWLVTVVALVSLAGLTGASGALAGSATGSQNPALTVSASLMSSGSDPDRATVGDTVTGAASVTNQTDRRQKITLAVRLVGPDGASYNVSRNVVLSPHEAFTLDSSIAISSLLVTGIYTLDVSAGNANGASSASASIEIY